MKKKYLDLSHIERIQESTYKYKYIKEDYEGYVSSVKVEKVKSKLTVKYFEEESVLIDDGYKVIVYLPADEFFCASAMYDRFGDIVGWYFDITGENSVDEYGIPFFYDMYLDVAVSPDFEVSILDEDELKQAIDSNEVSTDEFDRAYNTYETIIKDYIPDKKFMVDFFRKYYDEFD